MNRFLLMASIPAAFFLSGCAQSIENVNKNLLAFGAGFFLQSITNLVVIAGTIVGLLMIQKGIIDYVMSSNGETLSSVVYGLAMIVVVIVAAFLVNFSTLNDAVNIDVSSAGSQLPKINPTPPGVKME